MLGMNPLEFGKQHAGLLAQNIHQHVQSAAVRHADHGFLHALLTGALQQMIEQRNQCLAAFQRKALLSDIFGVQIAFQRFRGGNRSRMRRRIAASNPLAPRAPSRRFCIQRFCPTSLMYMYSAPMLPQ